jgi:hypothetical protein
VESAHQPRVVAGFRERLDARRADAIDEVIPAHRGEHVEHVRSLAAGRRRGDRLHQQASRAADVAAVEQVLGGREPSPSQAHRIRGGGHLARQRGQVGGRVGCTATPGLPRRPFEGDRHGLVRTMGGQRQVTGPDFEIRRQ